MAFRDTVFPVGQECKPSCNDLGREIAINVFNGSLVDTRYETTSHNPLTQTDRNVMLKDTIKLPRNKRFAEQAKATKAVLKLDADIANATKDLAVQLHKADWFRTCCMIALRVNDCTTLALVTALNDVIQAGRNIEAAQRKRISAAIGSPTVAEWVNAGNGCKSGNAVKKMLAKRDITSLHSLRKELARIAKSEKADKTEADILAELVEANENGRSELGILDPHGVDGLQGLFDKMRKLIRECESVPTEDAPILEAAILAGFNKFTAAGEKREIAIEKAEAKAERQAQKKAA